MRRRAALGFMAATVAIQSEAVAATDCVSLSAYPAAAPIEPGEPAALLAVAGSWPLDGLSVKLFDARGSELPMFVDAQSGGEALFLRSTTRLEPGDYFVEYTHECNGTSLIPLSSSPTKHATPSSHGASYSGRYTRAGALGATPYAAL